MKVWLFHLAILSALALAQALLPPYHANNLARIMVLAVYAMGYNIAFGYSGLLSLGHALLFGAGMYAAGLLLHHAGLAALPALLTGALAGGMVAALVGLLALRTAGVSFMIVTLMFAQVGYLTILYFNGFTGGDEGIALSGDQRRILGVDMTQDGPRFWAAFLLFALALTANLLIVGSRFGRIMLAMRENEERSRMLGFNPYTTKLKILLISGIYSGAAGAAYAILFGYFGASFASVQYSILPMLYVLLGGAGTVLGPLLGAGLMFYLVDFTSSLTTAYLFVVGAALVIIVLFAPKGILGAVRARWLKWLP
ncbi:MAG: branched-chain amino acid ABC transporter permease [Pseudorhodobacter sp.]|nr:MAG: branched-chain amino acid ABC transporter permease [Pseudorhodobacter sp.]